MEDFNIKKDLEQLNPLLKKLRKQEANEIPSEYFKSLRQNIHAQTVDKELVKPNIIFQHPVFKIAASVVILIGIGVGSYSFLNQNKQQTATLTLEDLSTSEILDYIDENITDFSDDELVLLLSEGEL